MPTAGCSSTGASASTARSVPTPARAAGPEPFIRSFASFLEPLIIEAGNANARINLDGNRAIKIEFNAPVAIDTLGIVDPFVDLILGLDRRGAPGVWIPNRRRNGWEPAHPQRHTELMTQVGDRALIVHRAHVIRLEKRAVKRDGKRTGTDAICSWNLSALALGIVAERGPIADVLAQTLAASAASIARELTEDPAHVAGEIALPDGMTREVTSQRLGAMAGIVEQAAAAGSIAEARRILSPLFGVEIDNIRAREQLVVTREPLNRALRGGDRAGIAAALGARTLKPARSDGDHR